MFKRSRIFAFLVLSLVYVFGAGQARGQASGTIEGVVKDPSGGVVPNATVEISYAVSGYQRQVTTGGDGTFRFTNIPFNTYHMVVTASGFASFTQDVDVRSAVPANVPVSLKVGTANITVNVEVNGGDLVENESTFHTDVDQAIIDKLPLESASSSVSSMVTLVTPGIAADSNGLFHGLGDHAENSFSVDGQPITDQQSKVFSNQIPADSIQSLEVISGAPPAEFGDKTSIVIKVTTKSGLGVTKPTGSVYADYGSFGTGNVGFNFAYGGPKWGNFISANGLNSGRFLDPPEFTVFHAKGNEENIFDRLDFQISGKDTLHLNLNYTRSWFQTPNAFDNLNVLDVNGNNVGNADQRSKIGTYNIAPVWTRLISPTTLFTFGAFVRHDQFNYYGSPNPLADFSPIQSESIGQDRRLTNAGLRSDISYVKGINNIKAGVTYQQTFLTENDNLAIVNPTLNSPCLDALGNPQPGFTDPSQCAAGGLQPNTQMNPNASAPFSPLLGCFDLTRPTPAAGDGCTSATSTFHLFHGHTDVKELALYVQDTITKGNWSLNLGIRGDVYNGLSTYGAPEPRLGAAYNIKPSNTVLRVSYARIIETPFNENLVVASNGCNDPVVNGIFFASSGGSPCLAVPLHPGWRNEFHAGFQQAFGKYLVVDAEYLWKYTHYGFDFSILGNTPVTFPVEWHNSKIPGWALRASVPNFHGFTALVVMSSVAARFFQPQLSGLGVTPGGAGGTGVFRIDHDEKYNQTTHLQYQLPWKASPWVGFNWRYDSGLVVSGVPDAGVALGLTPNQQVTIGLACNGVFATVTAPLTDCVGPGGTEGRVTSKLITLPQGGYDNFPSQADADHNPDRVKPRHLFDVAVGDDNVFRGDRYRWSLRFTVINLTNKVALYNFLSSFTGTHFVTPRAETVELGFHF
jgi:hypothetical protein